MFACHSFLEITMVYFCNIVNNSALIAVYNAIIIKLKNVSLHVSSLSIYFLMANTLILSCTSRCELSYLLQCG